MDSPVPGTSPHRHAWVAQTDDLWSVASRYYLASGWGNFSDFVDAIRAANPQVGVAPDWDHIATGSVVLVPFLGAGA